MSVWARAGAVSKNVAVNKIAKAKMRIRASAGVASGEREDLPRKGHSPSHYCRFDGPGPSCIMFTAKQEPILQLQSTLTCPKRSYQAVDTMPTDACQFFYDCKGCGARLKPLTGDCCVFCSYGSVPCPPTQSNLRCCVPKVH